MVGHETGLGSGELPSHRQQRVARRGAAIGRCGRDRSGPHAGRAGASEKSEAFDYRLTRSAPDLPVCRYRARSNTLRHRSVGKPLTTNPLHDVRVRRALSLAINRDGIKDRIMDGFAVPTGQVMPQGASGYDPSIAPDPYDPAQARKLLTEAGFPNGFAITLKAPTIVTSTTAPCGGHRPGWTRVASRRSSIQCHQRHSSAERSGRNQYLFDRWASDTGEASSNLLHLIASSNPPRAATPSSTIALCQRPDGHAD